MHQIDYLKNHPHYVPILAKWSFKTWSKYNPNFTIERAQKRFNEHLNEDYLPITFVALSNKNPIGMCSLRISDGIRPHLTPWLGSLYVDVPYRKHGIGFQLIQTVINQAKLMNYNKVHLLTYDLEISSWYQKLGWTFVESDLLNGHHVSILDFGI